MRSSAVRPFGAGPFGPFGGMGGPPPDPGPKFTLVFWSGTKQEISVPAEVAADDSAADLAVLKFRTAHALPRPLDVRQHPRLVETMPLYIHSLVNAPGGAERSVRLVVVCILIAAAALGVAEYLDRRGRGQRTIG